MDVDVMSVVEGMMMWMEVPTFLLLKIIVSVMTMSRDHSTLLTIVG
jgi:hypothetical protein